MKFVLQFQAVVRAGLCTVASVLFGSLACAQTIPAVHLINQSSQNAMAVLNSGAPFTTDFRGTNDVTITPLAGTVNSDVYMDNYGGSTPGNNPSYLTTFVGATANGTGSGAAGGFDLLETNLGGTNLSLQYDFAQPLTSVDRIIVADVDNDEQYQVQAYRLVNGEYEAVSLAGWVHESFSGQTGTTPDATRASWDPATGTLTSNAGGAGHNLNEPLDILTPDQPVDRIVFTKLAGSDGSAEIQVVEAIPALPTVTLTAPAPSAVAGSGQDAEFLLTLSAAQASDVTVNFTIKGSALNGTDYVLLKASKKIKAGHASKPVKIIPQGDLGGAAKKTVVLALLPGDGYQVGTAGKVKVKITD